MFELQTLVRRVSMIPAIVTFLFIGSSTQAEGLAAKCGQYKIIGTVANQGGTTNLKVFEGTKSEIRFELNASSSLERRKLRSYAGSTVEVTGELVQPVAGFRGVLQVSSSHLANPDPLNVLQQKRIYPLALKPCRDTRR